MGHLGPIEVFFAGGLVAWFAASVANQFDWTEKTRFRRVLGSFFVPKWTFFAPNPGDTDFILSYRDHTADGQVTQWIQVSMQDPRSIRNAIWNPQRRYVKLIMDLGQLLETSTSSTKNKESIAISLPYLMIANYLDHLPRDPQMVYRQFKIEESYGFITSEPHFLVLRSAAMRFADGSN